MTALRFRCHPVAAEAALRTASRRIESIHAQVAETMLIRWSDMAVKKALELSAESSGLTLLANTFAAADR